MSTVITVENLSKKYLLKHQSGQQPYVALRDVLSDGLRNFGRRLMGRGNTGNHGVEEEEFWALNDVSFMVKHGDRVGIIGRNGAGKSTLLKILSRITEPTTGSVRIRGRVASLLEVGTGFHPELTGRENIYLNGAILGMSRSEIRKKFDQIVDFAEMERFLDTPVKRFSSGMYVRLAFAVAAHLEPEILVVDEVLAVGDAQFQKKCLGKMENVASMGRTVLFVSHNMNVIAQLCNKSILLDKGQLMCFSDTDEVITHYMEHSTQKGIYGEYIGNDSDCSDYLKLLRMVLIDSNDNVCNKVKKGEELILLIEFELFKLKENLTLGVSLFDFNGNHLFRSLTTDSDPDSIQRYNIGKNIIKFTIPTNLLNEGQYSVVFDGSLYMERWDFNPLTNNNRFIMFEIEGGFTFSPFWRSKRAGLLAPISSWKVNE